MCPSCLLAPFMSCVFLAPFSLFVSEMMGIFQTISAHCVVDVRGGPLLLYPFIATKGTKDIKAAYKGQEGWARRA